ncbi:MAG: carbon monoxide dehydrogenase subunit G [Dehalococcoidia bacterium]
MPLFEDKFTVNTSQEEIWRFLMDVERLGRCVPGCEQVQAMDDTTFKARMKVKVGPFSTTQNVTMVLTQLDPPNRLAAQGQGEDSRMATKVNVKATLELSPVNNAETQIKYAINVTILGRLGMVGEPVMRAKAREMCGEFARRLKAAIEQGGQVWH